MKSRRPLTAEERRLWAHVAREVVPLAGKARPQPPEPDPVKTPPAEPATKPSGPADANPSVSRLMPLAPLERRTRAALRRGTRSIEGVIDLHGLRQAEAHEALLSFLRRSQARGHAMVLVITGKGTGPETGLFEERGVLRRMVPHWLRLPDVRPLILGFEEAALRHGGEGALYVRLRRRPAPDRA